MEIHSEGHAVVLTLTYDQLLLLAGGINEAIECVDDWEFGSRLGAEKDQARALRKELSDLISRLSTSN